MHIETIAYQATAPGTASGAIGTAVGGDSLIIKNGQGPATLLQAWNMNQTAGYHQLTFPSGHDTTRGFRYNAGTAADAKLTFGVGMEVEPQETITPTIVGSATGGDVETGILLVKYPNLPGVTGRYTTWSQLVQRTEKVTTVSATLTGAAAGYTGSELINAESDLLRANRDYAVLGMTTSLSCAAVCLRGPDTGYQRVSVPGNPDESQQLQEWFCLLARAYDDALIPIINSGNRNATFIDFVQNENNISPLVTVYLALLKR
jgi:hypothetical protein